MPSADLDPRAHRVLATASRVQILGLLRQSDRPLTVQEISDGVHLHANTVRAHLDQLVEAGLAARQTEPRSTPGRPRLVYSASTTDGRDGSADRDEAGYRLLATILASYLAGSTSNPTQAAVEAGRGWGRYLVKRPVPFSKTGPTTATNQMVQFLDEIGFAPEVTDDGDSIHLHHCPFRDVAVEHTDVVCSIHLGLMQGALEELGAPVQAVSLDPLVEPSLCVAHMGAPTA